MKISIILWVLTLFLAVVAPAQAETPIPSPASSAAYVSDRVEMPLRAGASTRHKVIGSVSNGSPVEVLKVDKAKGYTQIRTRAGVKGWIQSAQLTDAPGSQEQLASVRQQLERLQTQHSDLKQHVDNVVSRPEGEDLS